MRKSSPAPPERRMNDKLGTLEKGKLADVLIVAENPLTDIQNARSMRMVITDGRVVEIV